MMLLRLAATLAIPVVFGGGAAAQFTSTGPFAGTAGTEGFEIQDTTGDPFPECLEDRVFTGQADLCAPGGSAVITSVWGHSCSMDPNSGGRFFGTINSMAVYTFDSCVTRFGGYIGTNNPSFPDGQIRFYDGNGSLLHTDTITAPNDCSWTWNGWDTGGVLVKTIEIASNFTSGALVMMDDMEADIVPCGGGPGSQYCPGDGIAPHTPCPCGNSNDGSMGGCYWGAPSFPGGGILDAIGSTSLAANNTYLYARDVENDFGIFMGANNAVNSGNGHPLHDGLRCAGAGLVRLIQPTMATGNQLISPAPVQALDTGAAAGVTRRYQYWFRTPGGPCGQMANLTNGYEITWLP